MATSVPTPPIVGSIPQVGVELPMEISLVSLANLSGRAIGPGGSTISNIRKMSGARIDVTDILPDSAYRPIQIIGNVTQLTRALKELSDALNTDPTTGLHRFMTVSILVSNMQAACVIGHHGVEIKQIRDQSKAHVMISNTFHPETKLRFIKITGSRDDVHRTVSLIIARIAVGHTRGLAQQPYASHSFPSLSAAYAQINQQLAQLEPKAIDEKTLMQSKAPITGPKAMVEPTASQESDTKTTTRIIAVPREYCGLVVGKAGSFLSMLRQSGAAVSMSSKPNPAANAAANESYDGYLFGTCSFLDFVMRANHF